jgi:hypothetical protein
MKKNLTDYGIRDAFKFYKKKHAADENINSSEFSTICKDFNKRVSNLVIYENFSFLLPFRLGRIRIRKYKPKTYIQKDGTLDKSRLRPDWYATKKLWAKDPKAKEEKKLVFHLNNHTDGFQHRWFWEKLTSNVKNNSAYSFIPSRNNKRTLAFVLKNDELEVDYFE